MSMRQYLMHSKLLLNLPSPLLMLQLGDLLRGSRGKLAAEQHDVRLRPVNGVVHPPAKRTKRAKR